MFGRSGAVGGVFGFVVMAELGEEVVVLSQGVGHELPAVFDHEALGGTTAVLGTVVYGHALIKKAHKGYVSASFRVYFRLPYQHSGIPPSDIRVFWAGESGKPEQAEGSSNGGQVTAHGAERTECFLPITIRYRSLVARCFSY